MNTPDPHAPLKQFLDENAALFGRGADILSTAVISREYVTDRTGVRTVVWQQQLDGIPVFEALLKAHITKRGELASLSQRMLTDAEAAAKMTPAVRAAFIAASPLSARTALVNAIDHIREPGDPAQIQALTSQP